MFHVAGKVAAFYFKAIDFKGCLDSVCVFSFKNLHTVSVFFFSLSNRSLHFQHLRTKILLSDLHGRS